MADSHLLEKLILLEVKELDRQKLDQTIQTYSWVIDAKIHEILHSFITLDSLKFKEYLNDLDECLWIHLLVSIHQFLTIYVSINVYGYYSSWKSLKEILKMSDENYELIENISSERLQIDLEPIYPTCQCLFLLSLSIHLSKKLPQKYAMCSTFFQICCLSLWSDLFQTPMSRLADQATSLIKTGLGILQSSNTEITDQELLPICYLLMIKTLIQFREFDYASKLLSYVYGVTEIKLVVTGLLGKRTKHQEESVPQLVLLIEVDRAKRIATSYKEGDGLNLPKEVLIEDDIFLNSVQYDSPPDIPPLSRIQQATVAMACIHTFYANNMDEQRDIMSTPYIEMLLNRTDIWALKFGLLVIRSLLDSFTTRKHTRSIEQLCNLMEEWKEHSNSSSLSIKYWECSFLFPIWKLKETMANLYLKFGMLNSAVEMYQNAGLCDQMISCYIKLGRYEMAENLIQTKLEKKVTPNELCLMGLVKNDISYFINAWELSNHNFGKAQLYLGNHYFDKRNYLEAATCYEKCLKINSIQPKIWYNLGYCYEQNDQLTESCDALKRSTYHDPQDFKVWNDLACCLLKNNDLQSAYFCIKEAVKQSFLNWSVWRNLVLIALGLKRFADAIDGCYQICSISPKDLDPMFLCHLVQEIVLSEDHGEEIDSTKLSERKNLQVKLRSLFQKLVSKRDYDD